VLIRSFVVDTSVALSWLLPGEDTHRTLPLRDYAVENPQVELLIPPTFWYEVANVLWVAVRRNRIIQSAAIEALKSLLEFRLDVWVADPVTSLSLSFDQNLAVYDSAYLSIAVERNAALWTIDKALAEAGKRLNVLVEPAAEHS